MAEYLPPPDLTELLQSWEIALVAANKSPTTVSSYLRGVDLYLRWRRDGGHPLELTRAQVQRYQIELSAAGKEPNTVRPRGAALRQFAKWLGEEDELSEDPLLEACQGPSFRDKRDEALMRLLSETGLCAAECLALTVADVDLKRTMLD